MRTLVAVARPSMQSECQTFSVSATMSVSSWPVSVSLTPFYSFSSFSASVFSHAHCYVAFSWCTWHLAFSHICGSCLHLVEYFAVQHLFVFLIYPICILPLVTGDSLASHFLGSVTHMLSLSLFALSLYQSLSSCDHTLPFLVHFSTHSVLFTNSLVLCVFVPAKPICILVLTLRTPSHHRFS